MVAMRRDVTAAHFGEALRAQRKRQGLTQRQLADLAGVGERFISELERGKPTVELGRALHVLQVCGLEISVNPRARRG
jgi:y4mF family transcriptional regulator